MSAMKWMSRRLERSGFAIGLFAVAFLVLLPLLLPVGIIQNWIHNRMILRLARDTACAACGKRLGAEAIHLARERWAALVAAKHANAPGVRFRLVCDIDAICSHCGREYQYREADRSLILKPIDS